LEKIVIRTDQAEPDPLLVSLLNRFFPECGIHIVVNAENFESEGREEPSQKAFEDEKHG